MNAEGLLNSVRVARAILPILASILLAGLLLSGTLLLLCIDSHTAAAEIAPQQAYILVNTLEDELNSDGDCSLREAIIAANDNTPVDDCIAGDAVITDTIIFDVSGTITVTSQLSVTAGGPLVINGGEVITTSGGGTTRVWWVDTGSNLTLKHLAIAEGYTNHFDDGAGLYNYGGNLTIQQCEFIDNHMGYISNGGGIYSLGGTLYILDSYFKSNGSTGNGSWGGAISIDDANGIIIDSTFISNTSIGGWGDLSMIPGGGGIYLDNSSFIIQDSSFYSNTSLCGGGGIAIQGGSLTINNSTLSGNGGFHGGGISNRMGVMTVANSTLSGNRSVGAGGAMNNAGTLTVVNSTLFENSSGSGGAIINSATLIITNSTFTGNNAGSSGVIDNRGTLLVTNSTISGNNVDPDGRGIYQRYDGSTTVTNTIVANNPSGGDCFGTITDGGHNISSDDTCGFDSANGSMPNTDPLLDPLQDNGGSTLTHALLPGSLAIDAGDDAQCPLTDQRGVVRPIDGDIDGEAVCDIGSFEFEQGITLQPVDQSGSGALGSTVDYTLELFNFTNLTDKYTLTLGIHD